MNVNEKGIIYNRLQALLEEQYLYVLQLTEKKNYPESSIVKYNLLSSRARLMNHLMYDLGMHDEAIRADTVACKKAQEKFDKMNGG